MIDLLCFVGMIFFFAFMIYDGDKLVDEERKFWMDRSDYFQEKYYALLDEKNSTFKQEKEE